MKNHKYVINGIEGNDLDAVTLQLVKEDNGNLADICIAVLSQLRKEERATDALIALAVKQCPSCMGSGHLYHGPEVEDGGPCPACNLKATGTQSKES